MPASFAGRRTSGGTGCWHGEFSSVGRAVARGNVPGPILPEETNNTRTKEGCNAGSPDRTESFCPQWCLAVQSEAELREHEKTCIPKSARHSGGTEMDSSEVRKSGF